MYRTSRFTFLIAVLGLLAASLQNAVAGESASVNRDLVKVAAVQINGYDKGDLIREGYHPEDAFVPYIHRAGKDGA